LWQIKSRFREEVITPWIGGQSLAIKKGMTGATGNIYVGLQEFSDMMFSLHFLREGDLFLDIGANVGCYTVLASGVCKASTWAFEPDPASARALKRNVEINKLENLVTLNEFALGASDDVIRFTVGLDTTNRVASAGETKIQIVQQKMLDTVVVKMAPAMIKIDVEGYEENVLRGAKNVLAKNCLNAIVLETVSLKIEEMLVSNGFKRAYYDPFNHVLAPHPVGFASSNSLFIRDLAFVSARCAAAKKALVFGRAI